MGLLYLPRLVSFPMTSSWRNPHSTASSDISDWTREEGVVFLAPARRKRRLRKKRVSSSEESRSSVEMEEEEEEGGGEEGDEEGGRKAKRPRAAAERGEKERKKKRARKPPPVRLQEGFATSPIMHLYSQLLLFECDVLLSFYC